MTIYWVLLSLLVLNLLVRLVIWLDLMPLRLKLRRLNREAGRPIKPTWLEMLCEF